MKKPRATSAEERLQLTEHLYYEVQMTFDLIVHLVETFEEEPSLLSRNAKVESFAIHIRQLVAFLWEEERGRKADAFAVDYFAPGEWAALRPARPAQLDPALSDKVGWGVAHLTYGRARSTPADKEWRPVEMGLALAPAVLCFLDNVDPSQLSPGAVALARGHVETFLNMVTTIGIKPA